MDSLGVSNSQTAQIFDQATKSLGMSEDQLVGMTEKIHSTAQSLGKSTQEVFQDFASVSKQLAFYGEDVIDVFQELEKQSKATGIEVDKLVGISGQAFDTFDGAATKVGRLNAILGGPYLNSIDMLNATESERLEMLKNSIDQSGQLYSDMSKFEQLAIADALGVDVDTARRMFGELSAAEELQIKQQEKIAETARESQKVFAKFQNAVMSLIVALDPLITGLAIAVEWFSKAVKWVGDFKVELFGADRAIGKIIITGLGLLLLFKKFGAAGKVFGLITGPFKAAKKAMSGIFGGGAGGAGGGGMIAGIKSFLQAIKGSAKELLALGAAVAMIGGGIWLAATGLAELVKAFNGITNAGAALGAVIAVMAGFAVMLAILIPLSKVAALPLLAVGAAMLMIGGAVWLAAKGLAVLVKSFKGMSAEIGAFAAGVATMAGAITALVVAMTAFAFVGPAFAVTAAAFAGLAGAIIAFGLAVRTLPLAKLEALTAFNLSANLTVETTYRPDTGPSKAAMSAAEDRMGSARTSGGTYNKPTINFNEGAIIVKIGDTELKDIIGVVVDEKIGALDNR
jgi:hypothetical protein